jgi:hypothetical protein
MYVSKSFIQTAAVFSKELSKNEYVVYLSLLKIIFHKNIFQKKNL